jgi:hypothetical protein
MDGGLEKIREECAAVQVWNGDNPYGQNIHATRL